MLDKNYRGPSTGVGDSNKDPKSFLTEMNFASMSADELWKLHEMIEVVVAKKIAAEIIVLNRLLERLAADHTATHSGSPHVCKKCP
jgi:hypothetical protein